MKSIKIASLLFFFTVFMACHSASNGQTPKVVKTSFKQKYPNENDPDWRKDKNDNFEAHFKKGGIHYRADFNPEGTWIETEQSLKKKELPEAIAKVLKADFDDADIVEIEKVEHYQKGVFYDVEIKQDGNKKDLEFSENGQLLNQ